MSLGPPGVKPMTKRTAFSGNAWQRALEAKIAAAINPRSKPLRLTRRTTNNGGYHAKKVTPAPRSARRTVSAGSARGRDRAAQDPQGVCERAGARRALQEL